MTTITQDMRFHLSLIQYAEKFKVNKATIKYKTNRQYIYRWKHRYDSSIKSLQDRSHRPHHHPNIIAFTYSSLPTNTTSRTLKSQKRTMPSNLPSSYLKTLTFMVKISLSTFFPSSMG